MSHRYEEDVEEEDELQRILEGRDVEEYDERNDSDDGQQSRSEGSVAQDVDEDVDDYDVSDQRVANNRTIDERVKKRVDDRPLVERKRRIDDNVYSESTDASKTAIDGMTEDNDPIVKVKVRRLFKPRLVLNVDRLASRTGIVCLPEVFADMKFGGKGCELKDLNKVMFRLSHWSHRLFPSLTFDDFLDKCEQLGHKKPMKTFMTKLRLDMPLNLDPEFRDDVEDIDPKGDANVGYNHDFDAIIANSSVNTVPNQRMQDIDEMDSDLDDMNIDVDVNRDQLAVESQEVVEDHINREHLEVERQEVTEDKDNDYRDQVVVEAREEAEDEDINREHLEVEKQVIDEDNVNSEQLAEEVDEEEDNMITEEELLREINSSD